MEPGMIGLGRTYERFGPRAGDEFADKALSALRHKLGGHVERAATAEGGPR